MGKKFDNFEVMLKSVIHPVKCGLSVTETILLGTLMSLCSTYIKHTNHQDSKGIEELKHSINRITGELDR